MIPYDHALFFNILKTIDDYTHVYMMMSTLQFMYHHVILISLYIYLSSFHNFWVTFSLTVLKSKINPLRVAIGRWMAVRAT